MTCSCASDAGEDPDIGPRPMPVTEAVISSLFFGDDMANADQPLGQMAQELFRR